MKKYVSKFEEKEIIQEDYKYYMSELKKNLPVDEYGLTMKIGDSKYLTVNPESVKALVDFVKKYQIK
jgi:hypothetical protein